MNDREYLEKVLLENIELHNSLTLHKMQAKKLERRELFKSVATMLYPQWLKSASDVNYKQYIEAQGVTLTDIILASADEIAKPKELERSDESEIQGDE